MGGRAGAGEKGTGTDEKGNGREGERTRRGTDEKGNGREGERTRRGTDEKGNGREGERTRRGTDEKGNGREGERTRRGTDEKGNGREGERTRRGTDEKGNGREGERTRRGTDEHSKAPANRADSPPHSPVLCLGYLRDGLLFSLTRSCAAEPLSPVQPVRSESRPPAPAWRGSDLRNRGGCRDGSPHRCGTLGRPASSSRHGSP